MTILRIAHSVPDYDAWKQVFDSDPAGRQKAGVRGYQIARGIEDPGHVMIDLTFDDAASAQAMLEVLRGIWAHVQGIILNPEARIVDTVEVKQY